jgi:hypothetical protein
MKADNRREFLKKSVLGFSGVALVPGIMRKSAADSVLNPKSSVDKHGYCRYINIWSGKGSL